jgi:ribosome-binding protein aMBF1 (putative translation factor)
MRSADLTQKYRSVCDVRDAVLAQKAKLSGLERKAKRQPKSHEERFACRADLMRERSKRWSAAAEPARSFRKALGLSQAQMGERFGLTAKAVGHYERGYQLVPAAILQAMGAS